MAVVQSAHRHFTFFENYPNNLICLHLITFSFPPQERSWDIDPDKRAAYRCFGVKILTIGSGSYAAVQKMKFFVMDSLSPAFTENFQIAMMPFDNGHAGATSSLYYHGPKNAFEVSRGGHAHPWANRAGTFPHTVWYRYVLCEFPVRSYCTMTGNVMNFPRNPYSHLFC